MKKHIFKMECIENMHVGSGEVNYNLIDNEVQRDTLLSYLPVIHSSSMKGALKSHFKAAGRWDKGIKEADGEQVFGYQQKDCKNILKSYEGEYKFFTAKMLFRPLRVTCGNAPYVLATDIHILRDFSDFLSLLGISSFYEYSTELNGIGENEFWVSEKSEIYKIEDAKASKQNSSKAFSQLEKLMGCEIAITKSLEDFELPTIARNNIENKNLWYEEIVPRKSIFYFAIITPQDECKLNFKASEPVQLGANATIGQGYTLITSWGGF